MISSVVHDEVRRKVTAQFADLGQKHLKHISEPIRVFAWPTQGRTDSKAPPAALALPDRPSIAVLPFANMSGDPEQEFFSDGITEDIITELSRYKSLFVVARNSSFVFRDRAVDVREGGNRSWRPVCARRVRAQGW